MNGTRIWIRFLRTAYTRAFLFCFGLALPVGAESETLGTAIHTLEMPSKSYVVTVVEGRNEPRSIGSYALTLYNPIDPQWPFDAFVYGVVRERNGRVLSLLSDDINSDGSNDVVVVLQAAGSGGHLSADAFELRGDQLHLLGSVSELPESTDPTQHLRTLINTSITLSPPRIPNWVLILGLVLCAVNYVCLQNDRPAW